MGILPPVLWVIQWPARIRHETSLAHGVELRPFKVCRVLVLHVARIRLLCVWVHVVLTMQNSGFSPHPHKLPIVILYISNSVQLLLKFLRAVLRELLFL